jgi:hypothetical protein
MDKKRWLKVNALVPSEREKECINHHYYWTGSMPCTGVKRCYMCNKLEEED